MRDFPDLDDEDGTGDLVVLVVRLVSWRSELLHRMGELEVERLVWSLREKREAPLVLVSVEAGSTNEIVRAVARCTAKV